MDWEKAKTIIIVIFLILNIFLLGNLFQEKWTPGVSKEQISEAEDILKDKGIKLDAKIPTDAGKSYQLAFEGNSEIDTKKVFTKLLGTDNTGNDNSNLLISGDKQISIENKYTFLYTNKSPKGNVNLNNSKEIDKYILKFINDAGLPTADLVLDSIDIQPDSAKVFYIQKKGKYKLFDNRIEVVVTRSGITQLYCCLQKPSSQRTYNNNIIMPAYKVLLKNLGQLDGKVISSIDLGYTKSEDIDEMTGFYQKLYWRIGIKDEEPEFYDATSGELKKGK